MDKPLALSVVVTNHNYGAFLGECLESCLSQSGFDLECILVDDGSTDDSRAILSEYSKRPGLRIILQENLGQ